MTATVRVRRGSRKPRRRSRRAAVAIVAGALAAGLTFSAAPAARSPIQPLPTPATICLGEPLVAGARYRVKTGGSPKFKLIIKDPSGKVVLKKKGKAKKKWKRVSYVPVQAGTYTTTYKMGKTRRSYLTQVNDCSSPQPPPPPPPPPPAGTVEITDNDAGAAALVQSNAAPGASDTGCIVISYQGTLPATVRMYGTTTGTGLDQYLALTVTRGTGSGPFDSCAGFIPDATDYVGAGPGVVYSGTLQGWADSYTGGLVDPVPSSAETWTNGESHTYRFTLSLPAGAPDAAQGLTAGQTFIWEARD
jgi:hypothetical protein